MSQSGSFNDDSALADLESLTGDAGGAVYGDAAFNIDILGGTGLTMTGVPATSTMTMEVDAQENIIYVAKHGNDANSGLNIENAKLTIQAAVTAAVAGDTILVSPGTYTETITHAANNVAVIAQGKPSNCIITQADANIIDFNTRSGILYKKFGISCTAATTAISAVTGSTGTAVFRDCQLNMTSAAAIVAAAQPSIGAVTGAGTLTIRFGQHTYVHTGACGGTAQKSAFSVGTAGTVQLEFINSLTVTNSGTALVSAVGVDLATTGIFEIKDCRITVTDPDATIVAGLAYLGGVGLDHEFFRNEVHVVATNNIGYGFYSADVANNARFFYNHIHVEDTAGTSYSYHIGSTSVVVAVFDDVIADDGIDLVAGGTFTCSSSLIDGDFTCRGREAAGTVQTSIMNMDNTATASNAALNLSVGGTTSTGDPYVNWLVTGGGTFSMGIDNSDSDNFKITDGANPSTGNEILEITGYGPNNFATWAVEIIDNTISNAGDRVQINCQNNDNTDPASNAYFRSAVGGTSSGDPFFLCDVVGGGTFSIGIDNSDSDLLKITNGATPSAGTESFQVDANGYLRVQTRIGIGAGYVPVRRGVDMQENAAGASIGVYTDNTDNSNTGSHARYHAQVGGSNGGDPFISFGIDGGSAYSFGADNSDSDHLKITSGANPSAGNTLWQMTTAGERTLPLQPAFLATQTAAQNDLPTNANTTLTINNEVTDQNADYNAGTYTFTAPVTSNYHLNATVVLDDVDVTSTVYTLWLNTSNRNYEFVMNPSLDLSGDGDATFNLSVLADMDATDTSTVSFQISNDGAAQADVRVNVTTFSGYLAC